MRAISCHSLFHSLLAAFQPVQMLQPAKLSLPLASLRTYCRCLPAGAHCSQYVRAGLRTRSYSISVQEHAQRAPDPNLTLAQCARLGCDVTQPDPAIPPFSVAYHNSSVFSSPYVATSQPIRTTDPHIFHAYVQAAWLPRGLDQLFPVPLFLAQSRANSVQPTAPSPLHYTFVIYTYVTVA